MMIRAEERERGREGETRRALVRNSARRVPGDQLMVTRKRIALEVPAAMLPTFEVTVFDAKEL